MTRSGPYRPLQVCSIILLFIAAGLIAVDAFVFKVMDNWEAVNVTVYGSGLWSGCFLFLCATLGLAGSCSRRGPAIVSLVLSVFALMMGLGLGVCFLFVAVVSGESYQMAGISDVMSFVESHPFTTTHICLYVAMFFATIAQIVVCSKAVCGCCGGKIKPIAVTSVYTSQVPYAKLSY